MCDFSPASVFLPIILVPISGVLSGFLQLIERSEGWVPPTMIVLLLLPAIWPDWVPCGLWKYKARFQGFSGAFEPRCWDVVGTLASVELTSVEASSLQFLIIIFLILQPGMEPGDPAAEA